MKKTAASLFAVSAMSAALAACGGPAHDDNRPAPEPRPLLLNLPMEMHACTSDKHLVILQASFRVSADEQINDLRNLKNHVAVQGTILEDYMRPIVANMRSVDFEIIEMTAALGGEVPDNPMSAMTREDFPPLNNAFAERVAPIIGDGEMSFHIDEIMNSVGPHPECETI